MSIKTTRTQTALAKRRPYADFEAVQKNGGSVIAVEVFIGF